MPTSDVRSAKKRELLAYKAKLLQEIKYNDKRIEDVRSSCAKNSFVDYSDSSESDEEFSLSFDKGPSVSQLKLQQSMLRTCYQATQELINLQVLQSEVNVLVEDPVIEGEPPVQEPGTWREVTAECRVDLVPFSITFLMHKPERQFGQPSYRGLRVTPVKAAHEGELNKSVLPTVSKPSDAVEVLKSYAAAQRSRRTTLARLADRYPNELYMEPMPEGGYILKCANLLEVSWTLQNKWSPIAPFHHRMKFDLEYMDESYIKIITQAHRQLSDPSLETDERTLLLARIISTCLEAQGPTQELYESMSSDPENAQTLRARRTTLDQEPEAPGMKKKKEKELMAPPKSIPKKSKPKGKENISDNRKLKRSNTDENMSSVKRIRTDLDEERIISASGYKTSENTQNVENNANTNNVDKTKEKERASVASDKNNEARKVQNTNENQAADVDKDKNKDNEKNTQIPKAKPIKQKVDKVKEGTQSKNLQKVNNNDKNTDKHQQNKDKVPKSGEIPKKDNKTKEKDNDKGDVKNTAKDSKKVPKSADSVKNVVKNKEKSNADCEKVNDVATSKIKPDSAKTTDNKNIKEKASTVKGDQVKSVATIKNKQPSNEQIKAENKQDGKIVTKNNVASTQNKEPTKLKAPKDTANAENPKKDNNKLADGKKDTISNQNKPQSNKITKDKNLLAKNTQQNTKLQDNPKKSLKTVPINNSENTIEKVVEKRQSAATKRKNNMVDKVDNVASSKKISKPENPANSVEKIKKTPTGNKLQKSTKSVPTKVDQKFKSKMIPGGIKTIAGNTKALNNIEKQNSDVKSKIPQKKLSAISEANLKKNPLRISPRKIPSKFKTTSDLNKQKIIQKTTSIPRLLKKPVPKT